MSRIQLPPEIDLSPSRIYVNQNNIFILDTQKGTILAQYQTEKISDFTLNKDMIYLIQRNGKFFQALSAIDSRWKYFMEEQNNRYIIISTESHE